MSVDVKKKRMIYCATNSIDGKQYVGKWNGTFSALKCRHRRDARKGEPWVFHNAIRKHGFDVFVWEILFEGNVTKSTINRFERECIAELGTLKPGGYNMTAGGDGGNGVGHPGPRSPEFCRKMSERMRGRTHVELFGEAGAAARAEKVRAKMTGKKHKPESLAKMRAARAKQAPPNEETKQKIGARCRGKTYEEMYGPEKAASIKAGQAAAVIRRYKGKSFEELYGPERAAEIKQRISKTVHLHLEVKQHASG